MPQLTPLVENVDFEAVVVAGVYRSALHELWRLSVRFRVRLVYMEAGIVLLVVVEHGVVHGACESVVVVVVVLAFVGVVVSLACQGRCSEPCELCLCSCGSVRSVLV